MKFSKNIRIGLLFTIAIVLLSWNCGYFKSTNLIFTNNTAIYLDSVLFSLNNYKYKLESIAPNSTIKKTIYPDSIRLNNHDISVGASVFVKGKLLTYSDNYNDLDGDLANEYKLILKADSTLQLITGK